MTPTQMRSFVRRYVPRALYRIRNRIDGIWNRTPTSATADCMPDLTPEVRSTIDAVRAFTMTSPARIAALCNAVEYVVRNAIPGSIVECGVWRGGSMMAAALTLARLKEYRRDLYLFDTFQGMPPPTTMDQRFDGTDAASILAKSDKHTSDVWAVCQLDSVKAALSTTHYDDTRMHFVEGRVEETIPAYAPDEIAILRLDTDWYESTHHELFHLFPRLVNGGVLIIDDYGYWKGARRAVDEYITTNNLPLLLNRIDDTGRIAVKRS